MEEQKFIDLYSMIRQTSNQFETNGLKFTSQVQEMGLPFFNCLEVNNSSIHGLGVFANSDIPSGMVVGIYPSHGEMDDNGNVFCNEKYRREILATDKSIIDEYKIKLTDKTFVFGLPQIQEDYLLGHLINDSYPSVQDLKHIDTIESFSKGYEKYLINSIIRNNCVFVTYKDIIYVKTVKPISCGEELVTSYEISYWCEPLESSQVAEWFKIYIDSLSGKKKEYIQNLIREKFRRLKPASPSQEMCMALSNPGLISFLSNV